MVAFLMSDIEGSTRLAATMGDAFPALLDDHFRLVDAAITAQHGTLVSSEGDSVFAVFPTAREAVAAAADAQRLLASHSWPAGAAVKVRMGIHVGEAVRGGRDYAGLEVHRTARITNAGWGGQVLLSEAARALCGEALTEGVGFRDLGSHSLRDLPRPENLHQLLVPGLPAEFPALRTETVVMATNLPTAISRFVGRADEIAEIRDLLDVERLVTLTGPGGTGKTRLSVEAARTMLDRFPDGVWFVALDAVRDPQLVIPTVAQTLGVPEQPGRPIAAVLAEHLASIRVLLVLDNLEQVVEAGPDIAALLRATRALTMLASSREPLAVGGERIYPVPPLGIPAEPGHPTARAIGGAPSIELFIERARAVRRDFALTDENAPTVAAICRRLDGLPLAIELAAARLNLLTPQQILLRLDHRLTLLSGTRRDVPERQQTLRGAIDWSHDLLSVPERTFFRRFSVFAGGADLDAVSAVVDPRRELGADAVDVAAALVDRSLLTSTQESDAARVRMLETIREYATERLEEAGEAGEVASRHAEHYAAMAEGAGKLGSDPRRDEILDALELDLGNLRAALDWSLRTGRPETGLRLAIALKDFWHLRNHIAEGVRVLEELVAAAGSQGETEARARGMIVASELLTWLADGQRSLRLAEEGTAMAERLGDLQGVALGKNSLGWSLFFFDPARALPVFEEGVSASRAAGDRHSEMQTLMGQAGALLRLRDPDEADRIAREVIELGRRIGAPYITSFAFFTRGLVHAERGETSAALSYFAQGLRRAHEARAGVGTALGLDSFAAAAIVRDDVGRGARLAAAADRLRQEVGGGALYGAFGDRDPLEAAAAVMDPAAYDAAVEAGRSLSLDEAVALALEDEPASG